MEDRSILRAYVNLSSYALLALGILVMCGWYFEYLPLIQLSPRFVPMQFNTALAFTVSGALMYCLINEIKNGARYLSAILILFCLMILIQHILQINLKVDEFFIKSSLNIKYIYPGRMAANTACGFIFAGISGWFLSRAENEKLLSVSLLSSLLIFSIGLIGIFSNLKGLPPTYWVAQWLKVAFHTACGMIILSSGLIALIYEKKNKNTYVPIMPIGTGLLILSLTFLIWQLNQNLQIQNVNKQTLIKIESVKDALQISLDERLNAFSRIAHRWISSGATPENEWREDVIQYIKHQPGYRAIEWQNSNYIIKWVEPIVGNEKVLGLNLYDLTKKRTSIQDESFRTKRLLISDQINLIQGGVGILIYSPIFKKDIFDGFIVGVINTQAMFESLLKSTFYLGWSIKIYDEGNVLYQSAIQDETNYEEFKKETKLVLANQAWVIELWPSKENYNPYTVNLETKLILLIGIIISFLAALLVYMFEHSYKNSKLLLHAKLNLEFTNSRLNAIVEGSTDIVAAIDTRKKFIIFNQNFVNRIKILFNYTIQIGDNLQVILDQLNNDAKLKVKSFWDRALSGESFVVEDDLISLSESSKIYEMHFNPIKHKDIIIGASYSAIEITERKRNEKILIMSRENLTVNVKKLEDQNNQLNLLKQMIASIQMTETFDESLLVMKSYLPKLLKGTSGQLYVVDHLDINQLVKILTWGEPKSISNGFARLDCFAGLSNEKFIHKSGDGSRVCGHVLLSETQAFGYVCIPFYHKKELYGILCLELKEHQSKQDRFIDISEILTEQLAINIHSAKLRDTLRIYSSLDSLTGLLNRRFFEEVFTKNLSQRPKRFFIALIDIDRFKSINDSYGHLIGDQVILYIANSLKQTCHSKTQICRWGGDEVLLYLPLENINEFLIEIKKIKGSIDSAPLKVGENELVIKISVGVAMYPEDGDTLKELTLVADKSLYESKQQGRDQISYSVNIKKLM